MTQLHPDIRNTARALIIRENAVLLLRKRGPGRGEYYTLPGGGQQTGETLEQTVARECLEEIDAEVCLQDLLWVADYFRCRTTRRHVIEMVFRCDVPPLYEPRNGSQPDRYQVEVCWLRLDELERHTLAEPYLASAMASYSGQQASPVYLGCFRDPVFA
ncbi:MAG: NUDIX domain-containing protein [Marinobacter sp.]|uniref:NUDIX domain-containing protein n=1 Tax=Marinobacter sp. TaxID=50741 RepID=UPI00299CF78E|nr:NUDIX domain-containing protein [Marinobacter sp.]MDX1756335.1 NUDIX domain-containing protein [Marinobacter sp.]